MKTKFPFIALLDGPAIGHNPGTKRLVFVLGIDPWIDTIYYGYDIESLNIYDIYINTIKMIK